MPFSTHLVEVALAERSYVIHIGPGLLDTIEFVRAQMVPQIQGKKVAIVSNVTVAPLYLDNLRQQLESCGKQVIPIILPDGEKYKDWVSLNQIYTALLENQCSRNVTLIALGGGVIGDMTGFAAATYMRGVPFIQIPTTLLAQVDSSVGGKTGINHPLGKNMIGAFYQPQIVVIDTNTLNTLPERELTAGLAEVLKHGLIRDADYFDWTVKNLAAIRQRDTATLAQVIRRSVEIKAEVVSQDEREGGLRAILNFGHTFGHAIEAGMGYGEWLHGEAVGAGMALAADLSCRLGYITAEQQQSIQAALGAAGLPVLAPNLGLTNYLELMAVDKKATDTGVKFILLEKIGRAKIQTVPDDLLIATLHANLEKWGQSHI